jgi:hypothetical protein
MNKLMSKNKFLLFSLVLLLFSFFLSFYFLFLRTEKPIEIAVGVRDSIIELSKGGEHNLNDYGSMMYAPNVIRYNTCEGGSKVMNDDWAWSRDWIFLMIFDSLNSNLAQKPSFLTESTELMESLYAQFTSADGLLELYTLWGLESYCLPYLFLEDLQTESDLFKIQDTVELAKDLCHDFYNLGAAEAFCEKEGYCIDDDEFYSSLEYLFEHGTDAKEAKDDFSYFDDFNENKYYPVNTITDDFIFAYDENSELFINSTNFALLSGIAYFHYSVDFFEALLDVEPCLDDYDYYFGLLKAMGVKKKYLEDENLIYRHERIEESFMGLCDVHYPSFEDVVYNSNSLGDKIEIGYIFSDRLEDGFISEIIEGSLGNSLVKKRIDGTMYPFLDPVLLGSSGDDCFDMEISMTKNLKSSLYLLMFSAYEK